jgi:chemotaxis protein MotB
MSNDKLRPIIIIKKVKKGGHGGHHGGAWKIAYADFVTAMMAFFLLLWLLSSVPSKNLEGVADYFTPAVGLANKSGIGFDSGTHPKKTKKNQDKKAGGSIMPNSNAPAITTVQIPDSIKQALEKIDAQNFSNVQADLYKAMKSNSELSQFKDNVVVDETPEGLRIQIIDDQQRPMFIPGTSTLQPYTKKILLTITPYIKYMPNYISIGGHTSQNSKGKKDGDWDLSSERANSTRKFLTKEANINPEQIYRIQGYADQAPMVPSDPTSFKNIRLSLLLLRETVVPYQKQAAPQAVLGEHITKEEVMEEELIPTAADK